VGFAHFLPFPFRHSDLFRISGLGFRVSRHSSGGFTLYHTSTKSSTII